MRCSGLSALGNQCQNEAGKDGLCRRHRVPVKPHPLILTVHIVCKACGAVAVVRKALVRRLSERPSYYLCHVCNRTYKHPRPDDTILLVQGTINGSFFAFTVHEPSAEEAASVRRAKNLAAEALRIQTLEIETRAWLN